MSWRKKCRRHTTASESSTRHWAASAVHKPCFSDVFGQTLTELALENPRVCAITAAMRDGTGLKTFSETCPKRYFDVGIAEEHALSMACGMAKQGLIPGSRDLLNIFAALV